MSEAIFTAETGLRAFEAGLQAISNDSANLDTPGYKGSTVLFADLVGGGMSGGSEGTGDGVTTLGTAIDFSAGQMQSDGNPLDLAIDGDGYFTLRDADGNIHYTQDGQFQFNSSGTLVSTTTGEDVMAMGSGGSLVPITINSLQTNPASATSTVTFSGNLLSTATSDTVSTVTVIDSAGNSHTLSLSLTAITATPGSWTATLTDGTTTVGTGTIAFANGEPVPGQDTLSMTYTPAGGTAQPLELDFSSGVTSNSAGTASTLAVASQNGFTSGTLTGESFDGTGTLNLTYSNNQTAKGGQLALATFSSPDDIVALKSNEFAAKGGQGWQAGVAGAGSFGTIQSGEIESSNVDLSTEFSNLVIMQRGYQACSQVVSTASDMLSSLFNMVVK
jgi:flagellar hook protein FlgE